MQNFVIVVEGAHDASFLGHLLKTRGFQVERKLSSVPELWRPLFPVTFPADGEILERIMHFPEIYTLNEDTVGIITSGSDSKIISTLRDTLDVLGISAVAGIAVFADIDAHDATQRFASIRRQIEKMNTAADREGQPGYPVPVPQQAGIFTAEKPPVGVFLFPDNNTQGALEDILVACAE